MADDTDDVAQQLDSIADRLADLALDRLRQASDALRSEGTPDAHLLAEEKRITRARRAVEKAAQLLGGGAGGRAAFDDGP